MKILILNSKDRGGGAAEIARHVADGYVAAGHSVHWVVGTKQDLADESVTELPLRGDSGHLGRFGWRVLQLAGERSPQRARLRWRRILQTAHVRSTWAQWRGWEDFELPAARRLFELLPWEPDVVHAHNLHSFNHHTHFDLRLLPALSRRATTLVTLHDAWLLTGHCAHFVNCPRWSSGCGQCPDLGIFPPVRRDETHRNWQVKAALYAQSRLHLVGVSRWIAETAAASMLAPAIASLRVIPNGVDCRTFNPVVNRATLRRELGIPTDAKVVAFASELGARNPFRDFAAMQAVCVEVAARLAPHPLVAVELGSEQPHPRRSGNLEVRSPGFVVRSEVVRWLQASDVVLHAAVADTSPTLVYEAMACAKPVVATRVCGIPEQIDHGCTGVLVAAGAREKMTEAVHGLLRDEARCAALGNNARRRVENQFTVERMVAGYLTALAEITGRT